MAEKEPDDDTRHPDDLSSPEATRRRLLINVAVVALAAVFITVSFVLSQCSGQGRRTTSGSGSSVVASATTVAETTTTTPATELVTTTESASSIPADLADQLPYRGLAESYIDDSWLGPHDETAQVTYRKAAATEYIWRSRNGLDDKVFSAYCADGQVIAVTRWRSGTTYWPSVRGLPDLSADGSTRSDGAQASSDRPDPLDYSSPEEYADAAEPWFASQGSTDPWGDAYRYWEDEAGW